MTSPAEFDGLPQFVQELQMFSEILEETKGLIARDCATVSLTLSSSPAAMFASEVPRGIAGLAYISGIRLKARGCPGFS